MRNRHLLMHAQQAAEQHCDASLYMPVLLKLLSTHAVQGMGRVHRNGARAEVRRQ